MLRVRRLLHRGSLRNVQPDSLPCQAVLSGQLQRVSGRRLQLRLISDTPKGLTQPRQPLKLSSSPLVSVCRKYNRTQAFHMMFIIAGILFLVHRGTVFPFLFDHRNSTV